MTSPPFGLRALALASTFAFTVALRGGAALCLVAAPALSWAMSSEPVQLAPALATGPTATGTAPADVAIEERAWKLCRVHTTVLLNMPDRSTRVINDERLVALGEAVDLEREIPLTSGSMAAIVRFRVRIRASIAKSPGVIYHCTTEAMMASAVGFESAEVGKSQIRHAMLEVSGPGARIHEAFVSPELRARLVVAVEAEPVFGREEPTLAALIAPPSGEIHRFKVEAFLKEADRLTSIDQMTLAALEGQDAVFSLSRFSAATDVVDDRPLGSVATVTLPRVSMSGFEKDHVVQRTPSTRSSVELTSSQPDMDFLADHEVVGSSKGPAVHHSIKRKNPKLSKKKREEIIELQQIQAVRDAAIERSKTLPSGEAIPEGFARSWFEVHVTPLNVTRSVVQAELRVEGRLMLPGEKVQSTIAMKVIEYLPLGETFEIAVSELVHDRASDYDYIIKITPEP